MHSDTTSITFFGNFQGSIKGEDNQETNKEPINITYGHNKDHRPDCKQMVLGQITNEVGVALCSHPMDGNTSDVTWNKKALELVKEIQQEMEIGDAIYIADCKLVTMKLFLSMVDDIFFISRVPSRFDNKLQARIRREAYEADKWEDVGKLSASKKACTYQIQGFTKDVYGKKTRLVVVKSSASLAAFEGSMKKKRKAIERDIKKLQKKVFSCKDDAVQEWESFLKKHQKEPYLFSMELVEIKTEKRPVGRPGKNPKPPTVIIEWSLNIKMEEDQKKMKELRQKAESFVLISNVPKSISTTKQILEQYKGQVVVELNFKTIKSPALLSKVFLKKEERIEAMTMLIGVSLMIRALMLYQLRKGFQERGENPRIGYSGIALKNVTMGLFEYAMDSLEIERQDDGEYNIYIYGGPKAELRATKLLEYLGLDFSDLTGL